MRVEPGEHVPRYEAHLTVDVLPGVAADFARARGLRVTHVVLARGAVPSQVLLTARFAGGAPEEAVRWIRQLAAGVARELPLTRVKIELDLGGHTGALPPGVYSEAHVKVRADDFDALAAIAARHGAHLSRTASGEGRFLTLRAAGELDLAPLLAGLARPGIRVLRVDRERVLTDTNRALDAGWEVA